MSAGRILTLGLGSPFSELKYLPTIGLGQGAAPPPDDRDIGGRNPWIVQRIIQQRIARQRRDDEDFLAVITKFLKGN